MSFLLPKGPLLGFGEGGPQFDRKGTTDRMRNGQGGYQLRTHGGRVPIQWLIGTDGWGMYIHQPVVIVAAAAARCAAAPAGVRLHRRRGKHARLSRTPRRSTSSSPPRRIRPTSFGEFARITGFAELPPLWTFGYMQSHRTLGGPDEVKGIAQHVPREEACRAMR